MFRHLTFAVLMLLGTSAIEAQQPSDAQRRFTGNWRLVSFENVDEKGARRPSPFSGGRIMYDAHGNMAAQLTHNEAGRVTGTLTWERMR